MRRRYQDGTFGVTDDELTRELDQLDQVDRETTKDAMRADRELRVSHQREQAHQHLETVRDAGFSDEEAVALARHYDDQETILRQHARKRWAETFARMNPGAADREGE